MANLKGSTFAKQIKDASIRMNALGTGKSSDSKDAHSMRTLENRTSILNDFSRFAESQNLTGKLNEIMTTGNMENFLNDRLNGLSVETKETYIRSLGATVESLKNNNINISVSGRDFDSRVNEMKENYVPVVETGRALDSKQDFINALHGKSFNSAVMAETQLELGIRVSEAHKLVNDLERYINPNTGMVEGLKGKGGRIYEPKPISLDLVAKIRDSEPISVRAYQKHLQNLGVKSHDLRYTVAKELNELGMSKGDIATYLNHNRQEITNYYLDRA